MNTIENTTAQPRLIAVSKLEKSPLNARRTVRPDGFGELKASILAHGLMQNLVVTDAGDGAFLVIAGGRRVEAIAKNPLIAHDLLVFQVASTMLAEEPILDGPDVYFRRPRVIPTRGNEAPAVAGAFTAIAKSLPLNWLKPASEAARFDSFRSLPDTAKLDLLAYCVALTLKPKLAPAEGEEATAYDAALAITGGSVAGYWRPTRDNCLGRISRDRLLAVARDTIGEAWANSRASEKKALLVDQLDRAFADPAKYGRTPEQVEKLKSWLPIGMAFGTIPTPRPARAKKFRKVA